MRKGPHGPQFVRFPNVTAGGRRVQASNQAVEAGEPTPEQFASGPGQYVAAFTPAVGLQTTPAFAPGLMREFMASYAPRSTRMWAIMPKVFIDGLPGPSGTIEAGGLPVTSLGITPSTLGPTPAPIGQNPNGG